jgi:hypothetical protein
MSSSPPVEYRLPRIEPPPIVIRCPHCGQQRELATGYATSWDVAAYLGHLVESHWEMLELAHENVTVPAGWQSWQTI